MYNNLPDGYVEFDGCECPQCKGTGTELKACCVHAHVTNYNNCSECHEHAIEDTCDFCEGSGEVTSIAREYWLRGAMDERDL